MISDASVSVLLNEGSSRFSAPASYALASGPHDTLACRDLDGDGRPDLAVSDFHAGNVDILLNNGDGTLTASASYGAGVETAAIASGDVNGNKMADLVVLVRPRAGCALEYLALTRASA